MAYFVLLFQDSPDDYSAPILPTTSEYYILNLTGKTQILLVTEYQITDKFKGLAGCP